MARTKKVETQEQENVTPENYDGTMEEEPVTADYDEEKEEFEIPSSDVTEPVIERTDGEESTDEMPEEQQPDRIKVASRRQKRKIYQTEAVFTEEGLTKTTIQNTERHIEYIELASSVKARNVLRGRLMGMTLKLKNDKETPGKIPFAEIQYKKYWTVYIPANVLFDETIQPPEVIAGLKNEDTKVSFYKNIINRRINSQVDFIAVGVNEQAGIAIGSHIWAMSRKSAAYYSALRRDGKPDITSGMIVRGHVVQVNSLGIYVDLFGAETFIPNTELSWNQIADARDFYDVGTDIDVRILSIKQTALYDSLREKNYRVAKVQASVKQITQDPNKIYFNDIEEGDSGLGIVTQITEFGIFVLYKNKVQVKCGLYNGGNGEQPNIGDDLRVEITKKGIDKESGRCIYSGIIKHWIHKTV